MTPLVLSLAIIGIIAFSAFIWLVLVAFRERVSWGFLVLFFSPITAVIFAYKYWNEAQKPFVIFIVASTSYFTVIVYLFFTMGGAEMIGMAQRLLQGEFSEQEAVQFIEKTMDRMEESGILTDQDKQKLGEMREVFEEIKGNEEEETRSFQDISVRKAAEIIGETIKIKDRYGTILRGELIRIDKDSLILKKSMEGGSLEFQVSTKEIASMKVLR